MAETNSLTPVDFMLKFTESLIVETYNKLHDVYPRKAFASDLSTLRKRGNSEGEGFFCVTLPRLLGDYLTYLETGTFHLHSFARKKGTVYPCFLNELFRLASSHDTDISVKAFECLLQILISFKKLRGPYEEDVLQDYEDAFVETDNVDNDHTNEYDDLIVMWARAFCERIFSPIEESEELFDSLFSPRPGPGSTNTFLSHPHRWCANEIYEGIELLSLEYMYVNYLYMHADPFVKVLHCDGRKSIPPKARFKFVPKTRLKPRGICIEENEMQFLQQGLKSVMYAIIQSSPFVNGRINFKDQKINGRLALESSSDKKMATIDMSEASDRIYRKLVMRIFELCPRMSEWLESLSTQVITLPSGRDLACKKFAPMGSGICFPVMSVVHWTLIRAIIFLSLHDDSHASEVYVYGDDIVLPSQVYDSVVSILPRFGMKINATKSYCASSFRESCGVYAYKGVDVTPTFIKVIPKAMMEPDETSSTIAVESQLNSKDWVLTSGLVRSCTDIVRFALPTSPSIAWKRAERSIPSDNHSGVKIRWNGRLQKFEARVKCILTVETESSTLDKYPETSGYLRSLLTLARSHDSQWSNTKLKFGWRWISLSDIADENSYAQYLRHSVLGYNAALFSLRPVERRARMIAYNRN